ncbi:MAG: extracellular solute-binding protein [Firmicutes bacterium]|nr:extracellular solute-binding protein [Bacillota bacterium]
MRKNLATWFVLLVVFTLSAAVAANPLQEWGAGIKEEFGGTEITVAMATHPSTDGFRSMVQEFEDLTGITVRWDVMEEIYLHDKILTEHAARTGRYDVLMMDVVWMGEFANRRVVVPLDDYLADPQKTPAWFNYDDIVPAYSQGLGVYDKKVYGIPSAGESAFIAYRKDLFEKYGYDPASIKTYDDLLEAAQFFHNKEENLAGISMRGRRGHHIVYGWFQSLYPFGGAVFHPGTFDIAVETPETIASLQYFVDLMKFAPPGIENFSHEEATTTFMQGHAAIWFDATALAPWIEDQTKSKVAGSIGYLAPPTGPKGSAAAIAGWNLAVSASSTKADAAWAFINFMTSELKAEEYVKNGGVVTRASILRDPQFIEEYHYYPQVLESLDLAAVLVDQDIDWRPRIPEWPRIGEALGLNASLALTGQVTPEVAMERSAKEIENIMAGY